MLSERSIKVLKRDTKVIIALVLFGKTYVLMYCFSGGGDKAPGQLRLLRGARLAGRPVLRLHHHGAGQQQPEILARVLHGMRGTISLTNVD